MRPDRRPNMKNRTLFVRAPIVLATLSLAGCVDRGDWHEGPQLAPQALTATRALGAEQPDAAAWPADDWWRSYGDPQLDALVQEALAANPSLAMAQARLRAAQGQALAARAPLLPKGTFNGALNRQRFPVDGLFPPPFAGSYANQGELTLDFSYDLDFWGHNPSLAAAASSGVQAAEADRAAARLALAVAVVRAYVQLDLWYALLDVAQD